MDKPRLQDIPAKSAHLCLKVWQFMHNCLALPEHCSLLLALSGGADSTALAHILAILANSGYPLRLHAFTLNHGLRDEARGDLEFVLDFCSRLGIPCSCAETDVALVSSRLQMGLEETGRKIRYGLLEDERKKKNADFIVTGHHKNDLSEDILLRLIRGSGWPAVGGMAARDDHRRVIRPLLNIKKIQLITFLEDCGIKWRTDASNESENFRRNRLRKKILPALKKENPSLDETLYGLWELAQKDKEYWKNIIKNALAENPWVKDSSSSCATLILPKKLLDSLPTAGRLRLFLAAVRHLAGMAPWARGLQARAGTLFELDRAYADKRWNIQLQLPGKTTVMLKKGNIEFIVKKT